MSEGFVQVEGSWVSEAQQLVFEVVSPLLLASHDFLKLYSIVLVSLVLWLQDQVPGAEQLRAVVFPGDGLVFGLLRTGRHWPPPLGR